MAPTESEREVLKAAHQHQHMPKSPSNMKSGLSQQYAEVEESRLHQFLEGASFTSFMAVIILGNATMTQIEQEMADDDVEGLEWLIPEIVFNVIFFVEFLLKFTDEKFSYFRKAWNLFDFSLVVLGIVGTTFSIYAMTISTSGAGSEVPASETRMIRVAQIFRMMRIVRVFRVYRLWKLIGQKLTNKSTVDELAETMMKTQILKCFVRAHMRSQEKLVRYFGYHGKVDRPEVARILLQSEVSVYKAIVLCEKQKATLDELLVREVRAAEISKATTMVCEEFILSAHHNGVLNSVEADSMLEPLHHYLGKVVRELRDYHSGRIDFKKFAEHVQEDDGEDREAELEHEHIAENEYAMNDDNHYVNDEIELSDSDRSGPLEGIREEEEEEIEVSLNGNGIGLPEPVVVGKQDVGDRLQEPAQEPAPDEDNGNDKPRAKKKIKMKKKRADQEDGIPVSQEAQDDEGYAAEPQILKRNAPAPLQPTTPFNG